MAKARTQYVCSECGGARVGSPDAWGTVLSPYSRYLWGISAIMASPMAWPMRVYQIALPR